MALLGNASGSSISTGSFARVLAADTLHVDGLITQGGVGSGTQNIFIGGDAGGAPNNTGTTRSVIIGAAAGSQITTGDHVVAIGYQAGGAYGPALGSHNSFVAIGSGAGSKIVGNASRFVLLGNGAGGQAISPSNSVMIGFNAGALAYSGSVNILIGYQAGMAMGYNAGETPNNNIAIGYESMRSAGDATYNVAVGDNALRNITGIDNTAVGKNALRDTIDGDSNTAIGTEAMMDAGEDGKAVNQNTAVGDATLKSLETGNHNVAIGTNAMQHAITSSDNISIGYRSMYSNNHSNDPIKGTYGDENIVIGHTAAYASTGSSFHANVILGANAGFQTKGKENVLIGEFAGYDLESGQHNVVIGAQSARYSDTFETNVESVLVGYRTEASANGNSNENVFGFQTTGLGSNTVTLGNASVTDIYMAQDSGATIHAAGISGSAGNLALIGDISGSATSTGSFGRVVAAKSLRVIAGATLSASGDFVLGGGTGTSPMIKSDIGDNRINILEAGSTTAGIGIVDLDGGAKVGIGTLTPNTSLEVHGNVSGSATSTGSFGQLVVAGAKAIRIQTPIANASVFIGHDAGVDAGGAYNNIAIGRDSMGEITNGVSNIALGQDSLHTETTGDYNVAIGDSAMSLANDADHTIAIGKQAGQDLQGGSDDNILFGQATGAQLAFGDENIAIGKMALQNPKSGSFNIGIGSQALRNGNSTDAIFRYNVSLGTYAVGALISGQSNIGIGYGAMRNYGQVNSRIDDGIAIGREALRYLEKGDYNIAMGYQAMNNSRTGSYNIAIGHQALDQSNNGLSGVENDRNVVMGYFAGGSLKDGARNTLIGPYVMSAAGGDGKSISDNLFMGYYTAEKFQTGDKNVILGGQNAARNSRSGSINVVIGYRTSEGADNVQADIGEENIFIGHWTAGSSVGAYRNIGMGYRSLRASQPGSEYNVAIGHEALGGNVIGEYNIALGQYSQYQNDNGHDNISIGRKAMYTAGADGHAILDNISIGRETTKELENGNHNIAMGYQSFATAVSGSYNVLLGANTADAYVLYEDSVVIGAGAEANATGETNQIVIGHDAIGKGSNTVVLGDDNITDIYLSEDSGATIHAGAISGSLGVVEIKGDISGSATSTGSFGTVEANHFTGDGAGLANVPDYVFEPEYVLRPLSEVESYVSQSKHLPGIPSMDEMDKWAKYSVGDRDMLLLEKIEELTLYTIKLNRRIEAQQKDIEELKNR